MIRMSPAAGSSALKSKAWSPTGNHPGAKCFAGLLLTPGTEFFSSLTSCKELLWLQIALRWLMQGCFPHQSCDELAIAGRGAVELREGKGFCCTKTQ